MIEKCGLKKFGQPSRWTRMRIVSQLLSYGGTCMKAKKRTQNKDLNYNLNFDR